MRPPAVGHASASSSPPFDQWNSVPSHNKSERVSSLSSSSIDSQVARTMIHPRESQVLHAPNSPCSSPSTAWPSSVACNTSLLSPVNCTSRYHCWPYAMTGAIAPVSGTWHAFLSRFTDSGNLQAAWTRSSVQPLVRATSQITGETEQRKNSLSQSYSIIFRRHELTLLPLCCFRVSRSLPLSLSRSLPLCEKLIEGGQVT